MRRQSRKRVAVPVGITPQLIALHDVAVGDADGREVILINGAELTGLFHDLASTHGWQVSDLLANCSIEAGIKLPCCLVRELPDATHWFPSESDYIIAKLRRVPVVAGSSYVKLDGADPDYPGRGCTRSKRAAFPQAAPESPPRRSRRAPVMPKRVSECSRSPDTPGGVSKGCTQPRLVNLHRAAALSACKDPSAQNMDVIRHICGHSKCAVIAHFRPGSLLENELDKVHHTSHPSHARQSFQPWQ